jgi:alpha(1,3/1,4) fucosyltransferase
VNSDLALLIDPVTHHFERDRMFDPDGERGTKRRWDAELLSRWIQMRSWFQQRGVKVHTADCYFRGEVPASKYVFISFGQANRYKKVAHRQDFVLSAFFAMESPIVEPTQYYTRLHILQKHFKRIFTFTDIRDFAPFLRGEVRSELFHLPYMYHSIKPELWNNTDRKFLVMINHNKVPAVSWKELYTERMRAVEFFAQTNEIDLYGLGWNEPSYQLGQMWVPGTLQHIRRFFQKQWQRLNPDPLLQAARRVYRGSLPSKLEMLAQYNFALCFDNVQMNGWITEKIFDCFVTGTIPIYWGAPDVTRYVPAPCFIDMRQFSGYPQLRSYLKSMSKQEIQQYRDYGREYMTSEQFRPFTPEYFTERLKRLVEEDIGISLS